MADGQELGDFAGRAPGTDAERRAARNLEERLRALGREAETQPISVHPGFALTHALHALLAIVGSVLSVTQPGPGAALVLLAALSTFGDLTGSFYLLRRLTGRRASQNVTSCESTDKPGTLVLTAHYDASRGSDLLKRRPVLTVLFWAMFAVLVCTLVRLPGLEGIPLTLVQFVPTVVLIAVLPLLVDVPLSPVNRGEEVGPELVLELAERHGGKLEHFDVCIVLPGAHEGLMLGMRAWLKPRRRELDRSRTVFIDVSSGREGALRWITREGYVVPMRYHPELVRICDEIGEGRPLARWQGSDALIARTGGYPAIAVQVNADSRDRGYEFCSALIERLDAEVGPELA